MARQTLKEGFGSLIVALVLWVLKLIMALIMNQAPFRLYNTIININTIILTLSLLKQKGYNFKSIAGNA